MKKITNILQLNIHIFYDIMVKITITPIGGVPYEKNPRLSYAACTDCLFHSL